MFAQLRKQRGATIPTGVFLIAQLAIVVALGAAFSYRLADRSHQTALPALRETPLVLQFGYDDPQVISDQQLRAVLTKLAPRFSGKPAKINYIDHALRFWGVESKFPTLPDALPGEDMRRLLTDHSLFLAALGEDAEPLLLDGPLGPRVRVQQGPTTSSHVDHTMASLAEVGTPLSFPIVTPTQTLTFGDMVRQSLADFSLNQREYEWSALTFALLLEPTEGWTTSEGETINFDRMAKRIMRQDMPQGVCFGNHRLFTLVMLLRVNELNREPRLLSADAQDEIESYLNQMTARLVKHQHALGFWNADWPTAKPASAKPSGGTGDGPTERILATGHALEWWAIAPEHLHPPRGVIRRGGQWLADTIEKLDDEEVYEYYTYLSHAGRALALWRKRHPADVPLLPVASSRDGNKPQPDA